jgi:N-acetylglucosaminyl-diphospho-decaprenol L-rhamnosyltransferase
MDVSIVIVSWNTRGLLRECLASTLAACVELDRPTEVIVVDNASGDGSAQMVRDEFPTVRVIANTSNAGFAAATNQGIRCSAGRYLLLLNPDTTATSSFLRILVAFAESHPAAGAVGPKLVGKHGEDQVSCFPLPTLDREMWRLFHLDRFHERASYPLSRLRTATPQSVESIQGACMLIRREALEQAGLLDERFFIYTEEIDLCRRLLDLGWQIFWVPESVIVHHGAASTAQVGGRMFLELYRSKIQYFRKHLGAWGGVAYKVVLLAATLPRLVVPALAIAFVPSQRESSRSILRNYSSLLLQLRAL